MSRTTITIIAIVAFILLAIAASIPLFEKYKEYPAWKKILITSSVVLLFVVGCIDVYIRTTDNTLDKIAEGIKELSNRKKNNTAKVKSDTVTKYLNPPQEVKSALLRFSTQYQYAPTLLKTTQKDSFVVNYVIINTGTGSANHLKGFLMIVTLINNKFTVLPWKTFNESFDPSLSIYPGEQNGQPIQSRLNLPSKNDSTFICSKLDFSDGTNKRKSFISIYQIDTDHPNLTIVTEGLRKRIQVFLVKEKLWKPPFRQ